MWCGLPSNGGKLIRRPIISINSSISALTFTPPGMHQQLSHTRLMMIHVIHLPLSRSSELIWVVKCIASRSAGSLSSAEHSACALDSPPHGSRVGEIKEPSLCYIWCLYIYIVNVLVRNRTLLDKHF